MNLVTEIEQLLEEHRRWLKAKTALREVDGSWVEVTTPFLDRHNDALQIYLKRERDGFLLSDDRYIIHDLEASGCNLSKGKRQDLLRMTLAGFGVKLSDDALQIHATSDNFPLKKHNLIQAMLAVNDLFFLTRPVVESLFYEDVVAWLNNHEIRFTPSVKFNGTSSYDHLFDFVIPRSRLRPERIIQTINRPNRDSAEALILRWTDTRNVRSSESRAYAILNDEAQAIPSGVIEALTNYQIQPIRWQSREESVGELAA